MNKIGEVISRLKNNIKVGIDDAFITDRMIYSSVIKYGSLFMRRQDNANKIMRYNSIFRNLEFVELIDVDKVNLDCISITSGCTIKRTKNKLINLMEGYYGPIIRSVSSLDFSVDIKPTMPSIYEMISKQKTFKYNKTKYYWWGDGYLYFPNIEFDAVRMEVVPNGNISLYNCDTVEACTYVQDMNMPLPDFMFAEIEQLVLKDFGVLLQIPIDTNHDKQNITR